MDDIVTEPDRLSITLHHMSEQDHALADNVLADAFANNTITKILLGDRNVHDRLVLLNRRTVRNHHASGLIAEVNGKPAGTLITGDYPHCEPEGFAGLRFMFDAIRAIRWRLVSLFGLYREVSKNHPHWSHRHLSVLGVSQEFQGKGVGSALLRRFCDDADAAGMNSFLETDSEGGQRLYERFGFREVGRVTKNGITFIFMWRTAQKTLEPAPEDTEVYNPQTQ